MTEEIFKLSDGTRTRLRIEVPADRPAKAVVQYIHGFSEHATYAAVTALADFYTANGYVFVVHDQRGHGTMPGLTAKERWHKFGKVARYQDFVNDAASVRREIAVRFPDLPLILHGLSMGGNIALQMQLENRELPYEKVILESPWLGLSHPFPWAFEKLTFALRETLPQLTVGTNRGLTEIASHHFQTDPLFHGRISVGLYRMMEDQAQKILAQADKLTKPILLIVADGDTVVSSAQEEKLAALTGDNLTMVEFHEKHHVIHHKNPSSAQVYQAILDFLSAD